MPKRREGKAAKQQRRSREDQEIDALTNTQNLPPSGVYPPSFKKQTDDASAQSNDSYVFPKLFDELPISSRTKRGLTEGGYRTMTEIQKAVIPHGVAGRDIMGAARTGSGKTLAFLVPVLELLFRLKWGPSDGLGALILSPTRELALQIFEVLCKIGKEHAFSAGLVIGGKNIEEEAGHITTMNILVATPGRLLHHLDKTPLFEAHGLQILVIDEADRILDMGFSKTVDGILGHLPANRQTLLLSATLSTSVSRLAQLSLKSPEHIAMHEQTVSSTPHKLIQSVMVCDLPLKINILWSFLRTHTKSKILVFLSTAKQVRYVHATFRRLQPGLPVMEIQGKMKQMKRMAVYSAFAKAETGCLFATDIASRGLDFEGVDWVVQVDCPEDVPTYIHRVGRTARYKKGGRALLMLTPSEQVMLNLLAEAKIPLTHIQPNPKKTLSIQNQLTSLLAEDQELHYLGRKALISYMRSVHLQANKAVFDATALPVDAFAQSLGLAGTPRIRFTKTKKQDKNMPFNLRNMTSDKKSADDHAESKVDRTIKRKNATVLSEAYTRLREQEEENPNDTKPQDSLFSLRSRIDPDPEPEPKQSVRTVTNVPSISAASQQAYMARIAREMQEADSADKTQQKLRLREKRHEERQKLRAQALLDAEPGAQIATFDQEEEEPQSIEEEESHNEESSQEESEQEDNDETEGRGRKRKWGAVNDTSALEQMALSLLRQKGNQ